MDDPRYTQADRKLIEEAQSGENLIPLTPELLEELAAGTKAIQDDITGSFKKLLAPDRAALVRELRVERQYSWRAVAETCFLEWEEADWDPPSNQIYGMRLCEKV